MGEEMIKAILFDMDGTLLDSEIHYIEGTYIWMKRKGFKGDIQDLYCLVGKTMDETHLILAKLLNDKYTIEEIAKFNHDYFNYEKPLDFKKYIFDDVFASLKELKELGLKLAICSMSSLKDIDNFINSNNLVFDLVISGENCKKQKPDPEIYLKALGKLNITSDEAIVIEDSFNGIKASKNANIFTIARKDKRFNIPQEKAGADMFIDDLKDLSKYLKELNNE